MKRPMQATRRQPSTPHLSLTLAADQRMLLNTKLVQQQMTAHSLARAGNSP
jgi:hypothetical protein